MLETVFAILEYGDCKGEINSAVTRATNGKPVVACLIGLLNELRGCDASVDFHRAVQNTLCTIVCRTQSKLKFHNTYIFERCLWDKIVDVSGELCFDATTSRDMCDSMATFQRKAALHHSDEVKGQRGSLSDERSVCDTSSDHGANRPSAAAFNDGSLRLADVSLNRNSCMPAFLAALPLLPKEESSAMPHWMCTLRDTISSSTTPKNVRLFIFMILVNHQRHAEAKGWVLSVSHGSPIACI